MAPNTGQWLQVQVLDAPTKGLLWQAMANGEGTTLLIVEVGSALCKGNALKLAQVPATLWPRLSGNVLNLPCRVTHLVHKLPVDG